MCNIESFSAVFEHLTGQTPFPWQTELYRRFLDTESRLPRSCGIPTGLGKTSVIAVWLIALAARRAAIPRRLVYVVNRRTVVDQTTDEIERVRRNLRSKAELEWLRDEVGELGISTLRGQFADNREWSADPSRPAVICGTVDMIGSRLLFSGYGVGFKARPLHAGFLGQDALIVHDEAHLEPAFQKLIDTIRKEQSRSNDFVPMHVMELSATTRGNKTAPEETEGCRPCGLTEEERNPPDVLPEPMDNEPSIHTVWRRMKAVKRLSLITVDNENAVPAEIAKIAAPYEDLQAAVLVFARTVNAVAIIRKELEKTKRPVLTLTGTMRGKERDEFIDNPEFGRFAKEARSGDTVYLVCTSAGEVGIDISADHLVCDLSTFESMAQRFGRVNRYGLRTDTCVDVVHPSSFDEKHALASARDATLQLLQKLDGDASPKRLGEIMASLTEEQREGAFTPQPLIPIATDILFDAWALTTITQPMPGRPPVEPYLHGIAEWQPPETHVAWREEVSRITGELLERYPPLELLDDYPLLPHELLRDNSERVFDELQRIAARHPQAPVWRIDARGEVSVRTLAQLADSRATKAPAKKPLIKQIESCTVLLPLFVGGLTSQGLLDGNCDQPARDVVDDVIDTRGRLRRQRVGDDGEIPRHLRIIRTIEFGGKEGDSDEEEQREELWHWCDSPREGGRTANKQIELDRHVADVEDHAQRIVRKLSLPEEIAEAVIVAARLHDNGKRRERFQLTLGNRDYPDTVLAKSGGRSAARLPEPFRHEFASVLDSQVDADFKRLSEPMQDLVLHLIAAHHGRARPHFKLEKTFDPERSFSDAESLAIETPRRFARLQRRYGRWGLAYLESLLRAADWAASAAEAERTT